MQVNELRFGNIVHVNGEWFVLNGISEYHLCDMFCLRTNEFYPLYLDILKPVPLSDELFEQFGFEKKVDLFGKPKNTFPLDYIFTKDGLYIHKYTYPENVDVYEFRFPNIDPWIYSPVKLEYAHQLQNLFFALKGKELELTQKSE